MRENTACRSNIVAGYFAIQRETLYLIVNAKIIIYPANKSTE